MGNLTGLLTGAIQQWANNLKISDNEGNIEKDGTVAGRENAAWLIVRYITAAAQGLLL